MITWLVGLSGAGKTSIGRELYATWKTQDPATVLVDGDQMREIFLAADDDAYTKAGRLKNATRIVEICAWLDRQQINVVCCILCIFPEILAANRDRFSQYFEVFVDAPMDQLESRDGKGLYASARQGTMKNVVGIDIEFPIPQTPDLVFQNNTPVLDAGAAAATILDRLGVARG